MSKESGYVWFNDGSKEEFVASSPERAKSTARKILKGRRRRQKENGDELCITFVVFRKKTLSLDQGNHVEQNNSGRHLVGSRPPLARRFLNTVTHTHHGPVGHFQPA